ncbi:unnamed protein product [Cuscuta europaea]|uniref:Uncharacterized protein n=1 Tax=Cuscuta europaea TaxID=41803 RepID=A0A9P0Z996_CUSEU|nr:unnamed protein product [Cuscuta europaea]
MVGHHFAASVRVLKLGGYDMVMGVDLMKKLGPIMFDYDNHSVTFDHKGERVTVKGIQPDISIRMMTGKKMRKLLRKKKEIVSKFFCMVTSINGENKPSVKEELEELVEEFQVIFKESKELPPLRQHEHQIDIKSGEKPFKQFPYRYPYSQRQEIEKLVKEMLASEVIHHSHSPYSSPILLVKKKDGSWRFYVDYRRLNSINIKE